MLPDPFAAIDVAAARRELIAVGGTLDAPTLRSAYRHGVFPWPVRDALQRSLERNVPALVRRGEVVRLPGSDGLVPWCSPHPRAVLLPGELRISRSLRSRLRRCGWHTTVDRRFDDVMAASAEREGGSWITPAMRRGYGELHTAGQSGCTAHSLEVWDGDQLVGGLYGVLVGGVFCGESMFHRETDASKVALVDLVSRVVEAGGTLLDVQQDTAHLVSLGAELVGRDEYLELLGYLRDDVVRLPADRRPVARLVGA